MLKKRSLVAAAITAALVAGPMSAAPAQAQVGVDLPCEVFADPYDYPCGAAESTANFALGQVGDAMVFVIEVRDEAGRIVFTVYCRVFPNQPECP